MQQHKDILNSANAAIMAGDYEGFLSYCTDDTEWTFTGEQTLQGKDAVRAYMAKTYKEPPKFRVEHLIAGEDYVTAIGQITLDGTDYSYCDVWRFSNGKMAELKAFVIKVS